VSRIISLTQLYYPWFAVAGVLGCRSRGLGFKIEISLQISALSAPLSNWDIVSTLTEHCLWENETCGKGLSIRPRMVRLRRRSRQRFIMHGYLNASAICCCCCCCCSSIESAILLLFHFVFLFVSFSSPPSSPISSSFSSS